MGSRRNTDVENIVPSDDEGYEDSGRDYSHSENDLEGIASWVLEKLNTKTSYMPEWGGAEAFREFYQNWKDGILRAFKLNQRDFTVNYEKTAREILMQVFHPRPSSASQPQLLGYIRFKWDADSLGTLELANFLASLQRRHLEFGGTSKANDNSQAGQHGEGLKLAAMMMLRYPLNHSVRVLSSKFTWNFTLNRGKSLRCRLTRVNYEKEKAQDRERRENRVQRPLEIHVWEDVGVKIGEVRNIQTASGQKCKSKKIPLRDFEEWLKITTDIHPPKRRILVSSGDLILDWKDRIYLRGLLLPHGSLSGKPFKYSYNFLLGGTNRDRKAFTNSLEEAYQVWRIWHDVLMSPKDDQTKHELVEKYTDLLMKEINSAADVNRVGKYICEDVASLVWKYLTSQSAANSSIPKFYYNDTGDPKDPKIIGDYLKHLPVPISRELWDIFRKYKLCRTPQEELERRFDKLEPINIQPSPFSDHIIRGLKGSLRLHKHTEDIDIAFVDGEHLGIDVLFSDNKRRLKVNNRWMNFDGAHRDNICTRPLVKVGPALLNDSVTFWCDHTVVTLWDIMVDILPLSEGIQPLEAEKHRRSMKDLTRVKFAQMPRGITVEPTLTKGELRVRWESAESHLAWKYCDAEIRINLHREGSCSGFRTDLLSSCANRICRCENIGVSLGLESFVFTDLNPEYRYFPMISRLEDLSFFGIPPSPIRPLRLNLDSEEPHQPTELLQEILTHHSPGPLPNSRSVSPVEEPETPRDLWTVGNNIEFGDLPWNGRPSFPGGYDWFKTSNKPEDGVLIGKPRSSAGLNGMKHGLNEISEADNRLTKKTRFQ